MDFDKIDEASQQNKTISTCTSHNLPSKQRGNSTMEATIEWHKCYVHGA